MNKLLTLVLHARENTENDGEISNLYVNLEQSTVERLEKSEEAARSLSASVAFSLPGGDCDGAVDESISLTVLDTGEIEFGYTQRVRHAWPVSSTNTGIVTVSQISAAFDLIDRLPEPSGIAYLPNNDDTLYLFPRSRIENDEALQEKLDELMDEDPEVGGLAFEELAEMTT